MTALFVAPRPCNTCPYLRSTPRGIWHPTEYAKLVEYDDRGELPAIATFHCHQENVTKVPTVCKGWLGVHRDGIAVRFAVVRGDVSIDDVPTDQDPTLYSSGAEAQEFGTLPPSDLGAAALAAQAKLLARGTFRR